MCAIQCIRNDSLLLLLSNNTLSPLCCTISPPGSIMSYLQIQQKLLEMIMCMAFVTQ